VTGARVRRGKEAEQDRSEDCVTCAAGDRPRNAASMRIRDHKRSRMSQPRALSPLSGNRQRK